MPRALCESSVGASRRVPESNPRLASPREACTLPTDHSHPPIWILLEGRGAAE